VDWCYSASRRASGRILLKIRAPGGGGGGGGGVGGGVGGAGIYGRNWLACLVGGIFGK
jgi:hypothetical protein